MAEPFLYSCFDFCLRSEIELIELARADADDARPVVDVRVGPVPDELAGAEPARFGIQTASDEVLLTVTGNARYLVRGGREIIVDPAPAGSELNVRLFLLGSALGILCHQR